MTQTTKPDNRELRVFVSSTFRDFRRERDLLLNQVVPEVRARARERGVELTVVDLRWGLTDEQAELGGAVLTCLREVDECHPHFIGMLGERYGWVPQSNDWGADPSEPELSTRIADWIKAGESVTAMEIRHGVLDQPQEQQHAYFYRREAALTESLKAEDPENADAYDETDPQARHRQEKLRRQIGEGAKAGGWQSRDYPSLDVFTAKVLEDLLSDLDRCFPADEQPSELDRQRAAHRAYAQDRFALYVEPTCFLDEAFEAFQSPKGNHRLLLTGPSGIGKSSAVAALVQRFREAHPDGLVVEHYPGAVPGGRPVDILRRALEEMRARLGETEELPADEKSVIDAFPAWLARISHAGIDTLIALDALNQVESTGQGGARLSWLPDPSLEHVYLLVAAQPGEDASALAERGWTKRSIPELDAAQRRQIIVGFLGRRRKHLTDAQIERLVHAEATTKPLYLRVLLDELGAFGELKAADMNQDAFMDEVLDRYLACPNAAALYQKMIERLEEAFGARQCRRFFGLLVASRAGLSENELMQIGDLHPLLLTRLRYALDFHLSNRDGLFSFAHQALEQAATERCEVGPAQHHEIADFFAAQPFDARQAFELPWQWVQAQDWGPLKAYLSQWSAFAFFTADDTLPRYYEYMDYWRTSGADGKEIGERLLRGIEELGGDPVDVAAHLNLAGHFLHISGWFDCAEPLYREALDIREEVLGSEHSDTGVSYNNLGMSLQALGKLDEAEPLLREALAIQEKKVLDTEHQDTALSYNNLAVLLQAQDKLDEAESLHRKAVTIQKNVLDLEHPDTATSYNNLALLLSEGRKLDEAESLFCKALTIRKKVLGPEHPKTATSYNNLALLFSRQDRSDEAEPLYRKALAIRKKVLGPEHPATANSYNNLALLLVDEGKSDEAESLYYKALAIQEKVLAPEHPDTATTYNNLALLLSEGRKLDEAESLFCKALTIRKKALDPEHRDTATSYANLAFLLDRKGESEEAESLYHKALEIQEKVLDTDHPATATTNNNLALLFFRQGRLDEAEPLYRKALSIRKKGIDPENRDTATSYYNLAMLLRKQGKLGEAESCLRKAITILEHMLDPRQAYFLATSYDNLAVLLQGQGKLEAAELFFRKAITIWEYVLDPGDPDLADSYDNLAGLLKAQGKLDEAESFLRKAITIWENVPAPEDPDIAISYNNLAVLLRDQGKLEEAEQFFLKAITTWENALHPGHPDILPLYNSLTELYYSKASQDT